MPKLCKIWIVYNIFLKNQIILVLYSILLHERHFSSNCR